MARIERLYPDTLDAAQTALHQSILSGPRIGAAGSRRLADAEGRLGGPFNIWLRNPALGEAWSKIGETLRFAATLDRRIFELVVSTVAAHYHCPYEWAAHSVLAKTAGVDPSILTALERGEAPELKQADEVAAYIAARAILQHGRVDDATYAAMVHCFGEAGTFELVSTVGYYAALAQALNVFQVDPPDGFADPWNPPK